MLLGHGGGVPLQAGSKPRVPLLAVCLLVQSVTVRPAPHPPQPARLLPRLPRQAGKELLGAAAGEQREVVRVESVHLEGEGRDVVTGPERQAAAVQAGRLPHHRLCDGVTRRPPGTEVCP